MQGSTPPMMKGAMAAPSASVIVKTLTLTKISAAVASGNINPRPISRAMQRQKSSKSHRGTGPYDLSSAKRGAYEPIETTHLGFRVAKTLTP
jgi:hypothetical protein